MEFICEPSLLKYMEQKKRSVIAVETVTCNHSEIEITELHVYLPKDFRIRQLKEKEGYHTRKTTFGEVLLPPYKLYYDDVITFSLKSFLGIKYIGYKGIVNRH